jgi:hypothetical protein
MILPRNISINLSLDNLNLETRILHEFYYWEKRCSNFHQSLNMD